MSIRSIALIAIMLGVVGCEKNNDSKPPSTNIEPKKTEPTKSETIDFINGALLEGLRNDPETEKDGTINKFRIFETAKIDNTGRLLVRTFNTTGVLGNAGLKSEAKIIDVSFSLENDKLDKDIQKIVVKPARPGAIKSTHLGIMPDPDGKFSMSLTNNPNNIKIINALNHLKDILSKETDKF